MLKFSPRAMRVSLLCLLCWAAPGLAGDWPQWRHDAGRTACSPETLPKDLHLQWIRELTAPRSAWPASQKKLLFDASYEPIAASGLLIVGSMNDDTVTAYHAATGELAWRFHTDGPVRFAPVAHKGNIWAVSDDGYLYCLDATSGKLLWKMLGGPDGRKVIGNGRLVSMWPARGGPVIHDGTLYFAAGIWPFMGTFIYAIDPDTREVLWCNSANGSTWMTQQHGALAFAGVAPQGYLAADADTLLVSGGRTAPAAFEARTGKYKYCHLASREVGKNTGGYNVAATEGFYFNSNEMHNISDGSLATVVRADVYGRGEFYGLDKGKLFAGGMKLRDVEFVDRRGKKRKKPASPVLWSHKMPKTPRRLFMRAGETLYASIDGGVVAIDLTDPSQFAWQASIQGEAWTMLAAEGRLFVVTVDGRIYCFAGQAVAKPERHARRVPPTPAKAPAGTASKLIELSGAKAGHALVLGANAELVASLAAASELDIIVLDADAKRVAALRNRLGDSYGRRVAAIPTSLPEAKLPPYLARLIVASGTDPTEAMLRETYRVLRPYGGTACFSVSVTSADRVRQMVAALKLPGAEIAVANGWLTLKRQGPLLGSGSWTHQYADAGNSVVGTDRLARAPLGLLWFGGPANDKILPRHGHGPSPQVIGGRLFIEGRDLLRAVDVYTGRLLWDREIKDVGKFYDFTNHQPGANEIGSNYVSMADGVYVVTPHACMKLDPATGKTVREFKLPATTPADAKARWGFITVYDDYLIAALTPLEKGKPSDYASSSQMLVVMNRQTGRVLWQRQAEQVFRHNTIIAGKGKIFCIDSVSNAKRQTANRRGEKVDDKSSTLYALDAATGKVLWQTNEDIFGTWLGYSAGHDVLLQAGSGARDRAADEAKKGLAVYRAANGGVVWKDLELAYNGPCMLRRDTIITNGSGGFALNLMTGKRLTWPDPLTGKPVDWRYSRTYGCNTAIASENLITFRSGAAGYVDLTTGMGTGNLGGFKSGCTSNLIPADGVLNAPDYTRTCTCSYQNQTSLAMIHMPDVEQWTFFNSAGKPASALAQVNVNFGAPGDRQTRQACWLEFPFVGGPSPALDVKVTGGHAYCHHSALFTGKELTWVGASGLAGVDKVTIRLEHSRIPTRRKYTVRLVFAEPNTNAKPGDRVFNVAIQGQRALTSLDIVKEAAGPRRVITRKLTGVLIARTLIVEFDPVKGEPIICGIEAVAE